MIHVTVSSIATLPEILSYVCEVLIIAYTNDCTFVHVYLHVIEGKEGCKKNCQAN